ncbi:hypothetical protein TCAL_00046, partial [Tigriopus californicus]|eukprot:TCALIF_00046-PA protein Name:"Similar to Dctn1 Dynactin subunit 1 (Mus musculus)" AED:0.03 eAED:0.03 QI:247/1/0.66/1/1/1/3/0/1243
MASVKLGQRVQIKDKDLVGQVAFVGMTEFATGKWIGIILEEPKGKNNGSVQGKAYFNCQEKHGMFVRQTQIVLLDGSTPGGSRSSSRASSTADLSPGDGATPGSSAKKTTPTKLGATLGGVTPRSVIPKTALSGPGGSRLPMPGKGPTGSRSPSYTNLKAAKAQKEAVTPHAGMRKERSFVEKDFVETRKQTQPTMTTPSTTASGSPRTSISGTPGGGAIHAGSPALNDRLEEKVANLQAQQELMASQETIRDLEEKLETLKIKRAKDQEKLKDFEKIRIQHEQLSEFKVRIMESQAQLQKELQKAKHETREAIEAKEQHAEEMRELSETVEMATLDKEMAEEKAETLQIELDSAKEKIEELQLDLDIIKTEMEDGGGEGGNGSSGGDGGDKAMTNFEVKQQIAQNEKLRDTLVKMRDLLAHEKNENSKMTKDLEEKNAELEILNKQNDKGTKQNDELEATISDLQEQVDAALGSEEMVENLTVKCLDLEEKLAALEEERDDLEKLHEMNEELQENTREVELQLREDLELTQSKMREMIRARDAAYEIIGDHETTIKKFRELVNKVQEQNIELRSSLEKETNKPVATPTEMIDFKKMFAETKAHSKAIEMELRNCEVQQANQHVRYLSSYMGDSFMTRGGDNEAVLIILLIPRMMWKANILISQIKESFPSPDKIDRDSLLKGHSVEKFTFGNQMLHILEALVAQLSQFASALNTCSPETFLRIGTLYPEMSVHERSIDFYIELLRKATLDENVPFDNIEKSLNYFQHIYPLHLSAEKLDHPSFLSNHLKTLHSGMACLTSDIAIGKLLLAEGQENTEIGTLFKTAELEVNEIRQIVKTMKRRMPHDGSDALVTFPNSTAARISDLSKSITPLARAFHLFGKMAAQQAGIQGEPTLPAIKLSELIHQAIDKVFEFNDAGLETIKSTLSNSLSRITELNTAYQEGEWDLESMPPRPTPPVVLRANAYKAELKEAESLKAKLENKDLDIKELKLTLRAKSEEISEMQVRKDKAEKKLLDTSRDSELMREKMQRKVDDLQVLLKRKEKEFEETMDHLQNDIDSLESERGELKNKLKDITKKTLIEGITKSHALSGASGPTSLGPSISTPVKDSPMLVQHLQELQASFFALKAKSYERESEDLRQRLAKLPPLTLPKKHFRTSLEVEEQEKGDAPKETPNELADVMKKVTHLRSQVNQALVAPSVVDLRKKTGAETSLLTLASQKIQREKLADEVDRLRLEIAGLRA